MLSLYKNNNGHISWGDLIKRWEVEARANQLTSKTLKPVASQKPDPSLVMPAMLDIFNHYQMEEDELRQLLLDVTSYWLYHWKPNLASSREEMLRYITGLCRSDGSVAEAIKGLSLPASMAGTLMDVLQIMNDIQIRATYIVVGKLSKPILYVKGVTTVSITLMGLARRVHLAKNRSSRLRINDLLLRWIYVRENPDLEKYKFSRMLDTKSDTNVVYDKTISLDSDWEIKRDLALGFGEKHLSNFMSTVKRMRWGNVTILSAWLGHIYWPYWAQSILVDYEWDAVRQFTLNGNLPPPPSRMSLQYNNVPIRNTYYAQFWSGQPMFIRNKNTTYSSVGWRSGKKQTTLADIAKSAFNRDIKEEYTLTQAIPFLVYGPESMGSAPWSIYEKALYETMDGSQLVQWMQSDEKWFLYLIDPPLYNVTNENHSLSEKEWLDKAYSYSLSVTLHWLSDQMTNLLPKVSDQMVKKVTASVTQITIPANIRIRL